MTRVVGPELRAEMRRRIQSVVATSDFKYQRDIADRMGIALVNFSNIVNGRYLPSIRNLRRLAKLLNVTTDFLLCMDLDCDDDFDLYDAEEDKWPDG